ncbi:MAG: NTP transferase domain-containing protein [Oscillospiraceae bacterium]|nr:NTP transferase domain-containing protein [Oscillospiraceae bacterium]
MKSAGLITAAGLSSRMGSFKPLLELNGLPMLVHTVYSMQNAGLSPICVVLGHRSEELRPLLEPHGVLIAENPNPAGSDMLASVQLGLDKLKDCDGFFLLPGDMPLLSPGVFRAVMKKAEETGSSYVIPTVRGKAIHPPFIGRALYGQILSYGGEDGLRGALASVRRVTVEAGDMEMSRDADRPEDYEEILQTARKRLGLSDDGCRRLWDDCWTPEHVRRHCRATAELADHMARRLIDRGHFLDRLLCRSGAMLHDLLRLEHRHELAGAAYLRGLGYERLASCVEHHMTFDDLHPGLTEESLVFLADKLVKEDKRVSPQERYAPAMEKYDEETEIGKRVRRDLTAALRLCKLYESLTGECLMAGENEVMPC